MANILGKKVRISYLDHNERFGRALPVTGTVTRQHHTQKTNDWFRVDLDAQIEFNSQTFTYLLIRNRWEGGDFFDSDGTSVFIVLDPAGLLGDKPEIDISVYDHVAWGMATIDG